MSDNYVNKRLSELLDLEDTAEAAQEAPKKKTKEEAPPQEKLGLVEYEGGELLVAEINDEQDKSDRELARASIRNVLKLSNENLGALFMLAKATEHPRAFEVAATMAKAIIDAAGKLDEIVEPRVKASKSQSKVEDGATYNTQNNIFMSSEEAMKMLRKNKNSGDPIEIPTQVTEIHPSQN